MKRFFGAIITIMLLNVFISPIYAANEVVEGDIKIASNITYSDISRFAEVASVNRDKQARIVNAQEYKGSNNTWVVRLDFGDKQDRCEGDFIISFWPYACDKATKKVISLPFKDLKDGTTLFGPCWYYFGIFDENTHNLCGFAIAERIKRWPLWDDLTYFGRTYRGVYYDGNYNEPSNENFIENHIKK